MQLKKENLMRTFSNEMPPCRIKRIIWAPPSDILTIRFTSVVFVHECRSILNLRIERREGIDIGFPPRKEKNMMSKIQMLINLFESYM